MSSATAFIAFTWKDGFIHFGIGYGAVWILLSLHKFGHLDLLALVFGESSPEASLPALDFLHPGLLSLVHSFAYLGPSAPTSRVLRISSFLSLRSLVCSELTLSLSDMLRMDLMMLALDTVKLELSLLSQQILCFEPTLFAFGISQTGPFLLVLDVALLDSLLLSQDHCCLGLAVFLCSMAHLGLPVSVSDHSIIASALLLRNFNCMDLTSSICGASRAGFSPSFPDLASLELPLPSRHLCHFGFTMSTVDRASFELPISALDHTSLARCLQCKALVELT